MGGCQNSGTQKGASILTTTQIGPPAPPPQVKETAKEQGDPSRGSALASSRPDHEEQFNKGALTIRVPFTGSREGFLSGVYIGAIIIFNRVWGPIMQ